MTIEIKSISDPVDGFVEVRGCYIPTGSTCKCKEREFSYPLPDGSKIDHMKATIKYLIEKDL
jgi:hypothetical protein